MQTDNTHSSNITSASASTSDQLASSWLERITKANEHYKKWSSRHNCDKLEKYYLGEQCEPGANGYEPYVINLVFSTIETQLPSLLFDNPVFHIKPKPCGSAYDLEMAAKRAQLREDLLNTITSDPRVDFGNEIELSILDSFFRFGIVEVGYSANWVINPNADKPILKSDQKPYTDDKGNVIKQPAELPEDERIYVKRILASHFRVGGLEGITLERCNWCGYWEFVRLEDFKANKGLKNLDKLDWAGTRSADFVPESYGPEIDELTKSGDLLKIWHIWDNRKKKRYIFSDSQSLTHYEASFSRLPLFDLRPHRVIEGWYPLPPVRNWKSAQDEINDSHEQLRNHRKRFQRKYIYNKAAFSDEEELDKLLNGGDGTFVGSNSNDVSRVAAPLPNADLGTAASQSLVVDKDDFNIVSGTSSDQRGQNDRTTATQAQITSQASQIRSSRARTQIAKWLNRIGREILLLAEEKLTAPVWIKMAVPDGNMGEDIGQIQEIWHQITMNDIRSRNPETESFENDFDFEVGITLDSMSPIASEDEKNKFLLFISTLTQFPELSADPLLVRETAYRIGYRNEKVIQRMQQMAQLVLTQKLAALQGKAGGGGPVNGGNQMAQAQVAQQTPNNLEQIRQQVANQMGGV